MPGNGGKNENIDVVVFIVVVGVSRYDTYVGVLFISDDLIWHDELLLFGHLVD